MTTIILVADTAFLISCQ